MSPTPEHGAPPGERHHGEVSAEGLSRVHPIRAIEIREELGMPYEISVSVASEHEESIEFIELLGQDISVVVSAPGGGASRAWFGVLSEVHKDTEAGGDDGSGSGLPLVLTRLVIRPGLALGALGQVTRIFQDRTTPEILAEVLEEILGPRQREFDASSLDPGAYRKRDFCVQYKESSFAFVQRLMETDGIGYYFVQDPGASVEKLVLFDHPGSLPQITAPESGVLTYGAGGGDDSQQDAIPDFDLSYKHGANSVAVRDWDWTNPQSVQHAEARAGTESVAEVYEHGFGDHATFHEDAGLLAAQTAAAQAVMLPLGLVPGMLSRLEDISGTPLAPFSEGDLPGRARMRGELLVRDRAVASGTSTVLALSPGYTFELVGHPTLAADGEYLVTHVTHAVGAPVEGSGDIRYHGLHNTFRCIPKAAPWRPSRRTPSPRIYGSQTAVVTGPPGIDIHTDPLGRIQVRFPWDRRDADLFAATSCWIRVGQTWAGHGHPGVSFIPRVGMEVVVTFIDGDPDRPVVMGCLNNAMHPTPGALPVQATKSIIRTRTVPLGRGYNELSFEDAQGMERVYVRAERDMDALAKRDRNAVIGRDERGTVKRDLALKVGRNHDVHVSGNATVAVRKDQRSEVGRDAHSRVDGSRFDTVGGAHMVVVNGRSHQLHVTDGVQVIEAARGLIHAQGDNTLRMFSPDTYAEDGDGPKGVEIGSPHEIELVSGSTRVSLNGHEEGAVVIQTPAASVTVCDERIELKLGASVIEVRAGFVRINNKTFPA